MIDKKIITILQNDGVGILPTDTLYGVVASAYSKKAVERIYKIKGRDENKPFIILISSIKDLEKFGVVEHPMLGKWPAKTSIILHHTNKTTSKKFNYLNRGTGALAFRLPKKKSLREFLKKTGPLVAPSANPQGIAPAENINQAKNYFEDKMDFYVAGGTLKSAPSTLLRINKNGEIEVLRGTLKNNAKQ
ncbi:MAG: L-threonylcarbamoyladenylate synthase [Patescibacteria group bacterium]